MGVGRVTLRMRARAVVRSAAMAMVVAAVAIASDAGVSGAGSSRIAPVFHVPILMYHRVVPVAGAGDSLPALVISPAAFAAQMDALETGGWHSITAARLADDLAAGAAPAARTFVLTIDDGTDDGYTYTYPILREHRFVASYYLVAGRIGHPHHLDAHQLQALVAGGNEVANHSLSHLHMPRLAHDQLVREIDSASDAIQAITGPRPATFAYPFGEWNADVSVAVGACSGLRMALTTAAGSGETWGSRFQVRRITVGPALTSADLLALMAQGA